MGNAEWIHIGEVIGGVPDDRRLCRRRSGAAPHEDGAALAGTRAACHGLVGDHRSGNRSSRDAGDWARHQRLGGVRGRSLSIINGTVVTLPNSAIAALASHPRVKYLSPDREVRGVMERTGPNVGATTARQDFGLDGAGIGVAVIDSGAAWHDDLSAGGGPQRVVYFVDYVTGHKNPYDDHGHGTHVAGIIAGNGFDSAGARSGIAPAANLVVLKVLDKTGRGRVSDVIAALDHVIAVRSRYNIRVVNMSVAAAILESVRPRSADGCRAAGGGGRTRCRGSRR